MCSKEKSVAPGQQQSGTVKAPLTRDLSDSAQPIKLVQPNSAPMPPDDEN